MHHVLLVGAGPLGLKVARFISERAGLRLVGVVDLNPDLVGKRLDELMNGDWGDIVISGSLDAALAAAEERPDVAVITTVSSISRILPTIREVARRRLSIVSTCEELSYPWTRHSHEAEEIDLICRENGVACLGTGVNPGFLMDYLPCVLSAVNQSVEHVLVERIQDASVRRVPFQKKIGAGLSLEEFVAAREAGTLRHVGLPESLDMIACGLGWELDERSESLEPVLAPDDIHIGYKPIRKGEPAGVEQIASGRIGGREVIRLHFRAAVGEELSYDRIRIAGQPGVEMTLTGGINGDVATCAITVNAIRAIARATPGLKTMLDISVPAWHAGRPVAAPVG